MTLISFRRVLRVAGGVALALSSAVLIGSTGARAGGEGWVVETLRGNARVVSPGVQPVVLSPSDRLAPGQRVVTGPRGRVVLRRGEETIVVAPNSKMGLPARNDGGFATRILQEIGTILLNVEHRTKQHFEVVTPYMAAVVKGTTFTVSVDGRGAAVHVLDGLVEVSRGDRRTFVRPGQTATSAARGGLINLQTSREPAAKTQLTARPDEAGRPDGRRDARGPRIRTTLGVADIDVGKATKGLLRAGRVRGAGVGGTVAAKPGGAPARAVGKPRSKRAKARGKAGTPGSASVARRPDAGGPPGHAGDKPGGGPPGHAGGRSGGGPPAGAPAAGAASAGAASAGAGNPGGQAASAAKAGNSGGRGAPAGQAGKPGAGASPKSRGGVGSSASAAGKGSGAKPGGNPKKGSAGKAKGGGPRKTRGGGRS